MKLLPIFLLALCLTSCTENHKYNYIYLHELTIDNEEVSDEDFAHVIGVLETTGLPVILRDEARELSGADKRNVLRLDIDLDHGNTRIDADLDIENYHNGRTLYEDEVKVLITEPDAERKAIDMLLGQAVEWIKEKAQ